MVHVRFSDSGSGNRLTLGGAKKRKSADGNKNNLYGKLIVLTVAVFLSSLLLAQGNPKVTGVDPRSGKVNDDITISGEDLGKDSVSAVFLSDDKSDYKATIVDQSADKIVMKVPQVKAGDYNVSIQVGKNILIKPLRFTVQE